MLDALVERTMDAARDAEPPDATPVDAERDFALQPPCEPFEFPPLAESVNGEEVCNYIDDDGDGRVDEGFDYVPLDHRAPLWGEDVGSWVPEQLRWSGRRFGFAWTAADSYFVTAGSDFCDASRPVRLHVEGNDAVAARMAAARGVFGVVFQVVNPPRAFVQFFSEDGLSLTEPIHVGERNGLATFFIDIASVEEDFAIFTETPDGRGVYQLMTALGENVHGPMPVLPGGAFVNGIGMVYDGEGIGFSWMGGGDGQGPIRFMRWRPDGEVLNPPFALREFGSVHHEIIVGMDAIGKNYVVPYVWDFLIGPDVALAAFVDMGPEVPSVRHVELGETVGATHGLVFATQGQFFLGGAYRGGERIGQIRLTPQGEIISASPCCAHRTMAAHGEGPFVGSRGIRLDNARTTPALFHFGCGEQ